MAISNIESRQFTALTWEIIYDFMSGPTPHLHIEPWDKENSVH